MWTEGYRFSVRRWTDLTHRPGTILAESPLRFPQARALLALDEAGGVILEVIYINYITLYICIICITQASPCHGFVSDWSVLCPSHSPPLANCISFEQSQKGDILPYNMMSLHAWVMRTGPTAPGGGRRHTTAWPWTSCSLLRSINYRVPVLLCFVAIGSNSFYLHRIYSFCEEFVKSSRMFSDVLGAFLCFSDFSRNPRPKALGVRVRLCCCGPWWLLCQRWRTGIRKCALRPVRPPKPSSKARMGRLWSKEVGQVGQVGRLESLSLAEPNISLISSPNIWNLQFLDLYTIPDQRADLMLMMQNWPAKQTRWQPCKCSRFRSLCIWSSFANLGGISGAPTQSCHEAAQLDTGLCWRC